MTEKLKICPFCGGEAKAFKTDGWEGRRYGVYCDGCGAERSDYREQAEALTAWNTRPSVVPDREGVAKAIHQAIGYFVIDGAQAELAADAIRSLLASQEG